MDIIKDQDVILILKTMLNKLDDRLVDHGERVAYLCMEMMHNTQAPKEQYLHVAKLALLHDIGAYKTDEVDAMLSFETNDVWEHAVYGYLFLSRLSPLKVNSDCILYHHMPYETLIKTGCSDKKTASLIHLCDRIDVAITQHVPLEFLLHQKGLFDPAQVAIFEEINKHQYLSNALKEKSYKDKMNQLYETIVLGEQEQKEYLEMLAYSIDFRSEFTVLHTIMTTALAVELGSQFHFNYDELKKLYFGALLHDIGKGAIPISILEKQGALDQVETRIMMSHVSIGEEILSGYIQEDILHMALAHHEKLDGSGYPYQWTAKDLTLCDRIVAIADILSALLGKRSYKEPFPLPKVCQIIQGMAHDNKIDAQVVQVFIDHQEDIMKQVSIHTERINQLYLAMQNDYVKLKRMCIELE